MFFQIIFLSLLSHLAVANNITMTLFPAIPQVSEIAANSTVLAGIRTYISSGASIIWGINAKRAKTAPATVPYDDDFYIDITTYSYQTEGRQVLTFFTGMPLSAIATADCKVTSSVSDAVTCQITTTPTAAPTAGATIKPIDFEMIWQGDNVVDYYYPFEFAVAFASSAVGLRMERVGQVVPGFVVAIVVTVLLLL
ncbi:hypothetical protein TWF694_000542 [Orbilia ellipsospora]|uniref:Uncharacterized protein n=1 Tax=Orbilia ellipsospora TaxID=2528407 RepID=A0AAV9XNX0_9PEZI